MPHQFSSALDAHLHFDSAVIDTVCRPDADRRLCFRGAVGLTQERIAKLFGFGLSH